MKKLSFINAVIIFGVGVLFASQEINKLDNRTQLSEIKVISATGFEQDIINAPATISVVTSDDISKKSYISIKDVIKNLSGIDINVYQQDISIRGMDPKYTMTLIDGKPISGREAGSFRSGGLTIKTLPPLNMIEKIEVIRGPMSSLYGSDAVGGIINIITKKATNEWGGSITSQYNIFKNKNSGDHWNTGIYLSGAIIKDLLSIELNALVSQKDEEKIDLEKEQLHLDGKSRSTNGGGKINLALSQNDRLSLDYQHSVNSQLFSEDISDSDYEAKYKKDIITLDHEGRYDKLSSQSYLKYDKSKYFGTKASNSNYKVGGDLKTLIFDSRVNYTNDKHILTLGFNYLFERFKSVSEDKSKRWNVALYGEDDFYISDDFILTLGARVNKNERYGYNLSPRIYGVYHLNDFFTLRGGVSTGYINPGLMASSSDSLTFAIGNAIATIGDSKIRAESSLNYEIGFAYNDEKINLSLVGFYSDFKDKISIKSICKDGNIFNESTWTCEHRGIRVHRVFKWSNLEDLYSTGLELNFDYQMLSNFKLRSNYTYTLTKYTKGQKKGQITNQMPEHRVNFGIDYLPIAKLNLWADAMFKSKEKDIVNPSYTEFGKPSHIIVDLGIVYKVNKNLHLNTGIYNLLNKTPSYKLASDEDELASFVEGRKFMLGFNLNF